MLVFHAALEHVATCRHAYAQVEALHGVWLRTLSIPTLALSRSGSMGRRVYSLRPLSLYLGSPFYRSGINTRSLPTLTRNYTSA